jgi:class 3 adenylate cyclase
MLIGMPKHFYIYLLFGLAGLGLAEQFNRNPMLTSAQIGVADWLFVRADGPRLGARPVDDAIVLVLFDKKSGDRLGYVHSYENDAKLFRRLIGSNARVVFDTRMIAAADEAAFGEIRPLLDQMLTLADNGRLMKDIWLGTELPANTEGKYANLLAQNVINSHPHAMRSLEARLYPLTYFVTTGPGETAPLAIARQVWGLGRATSTELGVQLRESGIISEWHRQSPEIVAKTDVPRGPYRIGEHAINWLSFESTTSLVPPAAFWVSYDPTPADYSRVSYVDVLEGKKLADFDDKIVIVGFDAAIDPTSDTYEVPSLRGKASAAEVVAASTQTLLDGRTMVPVPRWLSLLMAAALTILSAQATGLMKPLHGAVTALLLLAGYFFFAIAAYRAGWFPDCVVIPMCGVFTAVAGGLANAWMNLRSRRRILDMFGRYVPRAVVNQLMLRSELESLVLGGEVRDVTVLFADIRGFTTFSENLPPDRVVSELNALLEIMVACTFENEGTLDKFIGDAILVLFNAPLDQADHTVRAVRTAIAIQTRLAGHGSGLRVGIGVHRGQAVVGNIGTLQRMEYTAIGSTVNLAARLCESAKPGDVVVSQQVVDALGDTFACEPLGSIAVKGVTKPVAVSRVVLARTP